MILSAIVAMSINRAIGLNNQIPWHLPGDLKRFKTITSGHPIIMGRKTFDSIGRLLPGRENIILTRRDITIPGAVVLHSLDEALSYCQEKGTQEAFIIGGAEIYREALPKVQRLYLTIIEKEVEGDTFFPEYPTEEFEEVSREEVSEPIPHRFVTLKRKGG